MVNRLLPNSLILLSLSCASLFAEVRNKSEVPKKVIPAFKTINDYWLELTEAQRKEIINTTFLDAANKIKLTPEVIKDQYYSLEKKEQFLNNILVENATKKDKVQLIPGVIKDQLNSLENKEQFLNDLLIENSTKEDKVQLTPEVIKDQYYSLHEPEKLLNDLLNEYSPTQRQEFINNLLESYTNQELMLNLPDEECKAVGDRANPVYFGATPIVDWLNTAHFNGFFQPTMTYALVNRDVFNEFDSFNQWNLWVEPFGFYTKFRRDVDPLKFNMYTAGVSAGGEYTFFDRLVLGLGLAYSHSGVDWQEHHSTASLNSLYFGPRLSYVFSHGYLSGTLFGVANFYQIDREINLFPTKMKPGSTTTAYQSWDVVARLEGGLAYEAGSHFFLYPTARVDYLYVLQPETSEKLDDEIEMKIEAFNETFLCSKAGLKVTREFFGETIGYLIPSVSAGWIYFTPQSNKSYQYEMEGCSKFEKEVKSGSWNQYYLGAGFALVHKKGILVSLDYELTLGADSPLQAGNIRVEWSW